MNTKFERYMLCEWCNLPVLCF